MAMLERDDDRAAHQRKVWREQKRRQRESERTGEGNVAVRYNDARLNKLVRFGCLPDREAYSRDEIARAIEQLIDQAE